MRSAAGREALAAAERPLISAGSPLEVAIRASLGKRPPDRIRHVPAPRRPFMNAVSGRPAHPQTA